MTSFFFTDGPFYRKLSRLALPISLQALLVALVAASDAAMLGRVDQNAMAAVSLATQVQFLQNMGVFAVTTALSLFGAQYWGKGDRESTGKFSLFVGLLAPRARLRLHLRRRGRQTAVGLPSLPPLQMGSESNPLTCFVVN
jgi:Na+-driven multidrug efflux pump